MRRGKDLLSAWGDTGIGEDAHPPHTGPYIRFSAPPAFVE